MSKVINIDAEFDNVVFDEHAINKATGNKIAAATRKMQWANSPERRIENGKRARENNKVLYGGYKFIVCSPGNDMLAFYDEQNVLLGKDNRAFSAIPPSIVYHYRFDHEYPAELFDKSKNYGRFAYLRDKLKHLKHDYDPTYWAQVYRTRYDWLVNKSHEEWVFDLGSDAGKFLTERTGQKCFNIQIAVHAITGQMLRKKTSHMYWRGKLRGWSIHAIPVEEYEKFKGSK